MNCPRCGTPMAKYKQRRDDFQKKGSKGDMILFKRTDFTIICKKCGEFDEHDRN